MPDRPLIPRSVLFGNWARVGPQISPDGNSLAWLQPRDGVMNLWVAPADDIHSARPLTNSARPLPPRSGHPSLTIGERGKEPDRPRKLSISDAGRGVLALKQQICDQDLRDCRRAVIGASPQLMRRRDRAMLSSIGRRRRFRGHTGDKSA
jgi:hypothetical protein